MNEEKIIIVDIKITRGLAVLIIVGLLSISLLGYTILSHEEAAASNRQTSSASSEVLRKYYLTKSTFKGAEAKTACANGYHFASIWEILDISNLMYNTDLGHTRHDSGMGPPSGTNGWIRTGYDNQGLSTIAGYANCEGWSRNDMNGTYACLNDNFDNIEENIGPFVTNGASCNLISIHVWCVED